MSEALKPLASERLVEILPRRGTLVGRLKAREVAQLFDVRLMIELHLAQALFALGEVDKFPQSVCQCMQRMHDATRQDDYSDYMTFIESFLEKRDQRLGGLEGGNQSGARKGPQEKPV